MNTKYVSYERWNNSEFQRLLYLCRENNIKDPKRLSWFITNNRIGCQFPTLAGDVWFSNGGMLENGISPEVYHDLRVDLGFARQSKSGVHVIGFTPNGEKYQREKQAQYVILKNHTLPPSPPSTAF